MSELQNIRKDIQSGALPKREILPFLVWLIGGSFWFWFGLIVLGLLAILAYAG